MVGGVCPPRFRRCVIARIITGCLVWLALLPLGVTAAEYPLPLPGNDLVGEIRTVTTRFEDTLSDIARANDLGYSEIVAANPGVDPWLPGAGIEIVLPTRFILPPGPREGIVINLPELRLYYYPKGEHRVITHPLGIGREGWSTPTGVTRVVRKKEHPSWTPPESIRREYEAEERPLPPVIGPGPDNPLGDYALYLGMPGYLLHGTNKPWGVGMRVSHGCIRLYPEDIQALFPRVPVGTPVRIINEPYKLGWDGGQLYLEAHRPLSEQQQGGEDIHAPLRETVARALEGRRLRPDWKQIRSAVLEHTGIPVPIATD